MKSINDLNYDEFTAIKEAFENKNIPEAKRLLESHGLSLLTDLRVSASQIEECCPYLLTPPDILLKYENFPSLPRILTRSSHPAGFLEKNKHSANLASHTTDHHAAEHHLQNDHNNSQQNHAI